MEKSTHCQTKQSAEWRKTSKSRTWQPRWSEGMSSPSPPTHCLEVESLQTIGTLSNREGHSVVQAEGPQCDGERDVTHQSMAERSLRRVPSEATWRSPRLFRLVVNLLPLLLLLLLLLAVGELQEDCEGRGVNCLACRARQRWQGEECRTLLCGPGSARQHLRRWRLLWPWRFVLLGLHLLPSPGHLLSPWGCVVSFLGQDHSDGHPLEATPLTEPSLTPPLGGSSVYSHRGYSHEVSNVRAINRKATPVWTLCGGFGADVA